MFGGLGLQDLKTSYSLIKLMLHELLEFGIDTSRQDREQALFEMFQDQFIVDNMSIFNEWLHLEVIGSLPFAVALFECSMKQTCCIPDVLPCISENMYHTVFCDIHIKES